jgi:hypothetical protein
MSFNPMIFLLLSFLMNGCLGGGTASGIRDVQQIPAPAPNPESCHESVIDTGSKSATTGQRRGSFSDVRLNPINGREAFAYYDFAALSMKFTYWNGSAYVHELVAGFGAEPNKVSMVFLSTGIPVIAWTSGSTNVMISIRNTNTSSASSGWSSRVFSSVATTARAIKLEVSPNNMVGGIYNTAAASGRMKMILCTSNCSDVNNYSNMNGATDFVGNDNNNTAASITAVGFAWCKADANVYYPAAVYGRIAPGNSTRFAMCPNSNTASCLTGAGWTVNSQLLTVSPTANISSALHIDASVLNDPPKILTLKAAVGAKAYLAGNGAVPIGCKDAVTGTTWDESTETLGGIATGNGWIDLMRSSNGRLHAVMNEGTTNIRYYNTDAGTLSTWDTFWNTGNGYLNTVTTSGSGGAVYDTTNDILYSSYYVNLAINQFNFLLNKVTSIPANSATVTSTNTVVNSNGHMALVTNVARNFVLSKTSTGEAGIAYVDYSAGTNTTGMLKYAFRNGREISSEWNVVTVPGVTAPESPYLRFDHLDRPWISYFDRTNVRFYLMFNSATDGLGTWTSYMMPPVGTPAAPIFPASNDTAIAMVQVGAVKKPLLIVLDNTAASRAVRSALLDSTTGSWSSVVSVYSVGATGSSGLDAHADSEGNFAASFLDRTAGTFLKYTSGTVVSGTPVFTTPIDIGNVSGAGQGTAIKINPITGSPVVTYLDRANNRLYRATCSDDTAGCATVPWTEEVLDLFTGLSGLTIATTFNENLASTAIALRDSGAYDIFYTHGMGAEGDLRRIKVDDTGAAGASSIWLAGRGANLASSLNFGVQGFHADAVVTPDNQLISVFVGHGNLLVQRTCDLELQD